MAWDEQNQHNNPLVHLFVGRAHYLPETVLYGISPRRRRLPVVRRRRAIEGLGQLERVLERIAHAGPRGEERARHQNDAVKKT